MTGKKSGDQGSPLFEYFMSEKDGIVVATLVGDLTPGVVPLLEQCRLELESKKDLKLVVLYFRDVNVIESEVIHAFTHLQKSARSKAVLRLSSIKPHIRENLLRMGIVRKQELADNLQEALSSAARQLKNAA